MKSFYDNWFLKSSIVEVIAPFIGVFNLLGVCTIQVRRRNFQLSTLAVATFVMNVLAGAYWLTIPRPFHGIASGNFTLMEFGVAMNFSFTLITSLVTLILNFLTRKFLIKLIRSLISFDRVASNLFIQSHRQELFGLLLFWITENVVLVIRAYSGAKKSLESFLANVYVATTFYMGNQLSVLLLILVAFRVRSTKKALIILFESRQSQTRSRFRSQKSSRFKTQLNSFSILINHIYNIIELMSKTFGLQMLTFFSNATILGMFTIFAAFRMFFNTASASTIEMFYIYRNYVIYSHFALFTICFITGFINHEVNKL